MRRVSAALLTTFALASGCADASPDGDAVAGQEQALTFSKLQSTSSTALQSSTLNSGAISTLNPGLIAKLPPGALVTKRAEQKSPPPVIVQWLDEGIDERGGMRARLMNPREERSTVQLVAVGLGVEITRREVGAYALAPGQALDVWVDAKQLPSVQAGTPIELEANVTRTDGSQVTVPATGTPVKLTDRGGVSVLRAPSQIEWNGTSTDQLAPALRTVDTISRIDRTALISQLSPEVIAQAPSTVMKLDPASYDKIVTTLPIDRYFPWPDFGGPNDFRVCATWRASYMDAGFGEDYLAGKGINDWPARYASVMITTSANKMVWQGTLDGAGCTPYVHLDPGSYQLVQTGSLWKDGTRIDVFFKKEGEYTYGEWLLTPFAVGTTTAGTKVSVHNTTHDAITRAGAVMSQLLYQPDMGLRKKAYYVRADQGCPSFGGFESCASGDTLYLGPPSPDQVKYQPYHDNFLKFVIAHEFGHIVQDQSMGFVRNDYDQNAAQWQCRCDHVKSANNLHCLQSSELTSAAQVEGFAQFFASKTFNNPNQADCTFVYYKEFREPGGAVLPPPMGRDCRAKVKWLESFCVAPDRGTEYDWMNFLLAVNTTTSNKSTLDDIAAVYTSACGGSACDWGDMTSWESLRSAAQTHFGSPLEAHYLHFINTGSVYGVSH